MPKRTAHTIGFSNIALGGGVPNASHCGPTTGSVDSDLEAFWGGRGIMTSQRYPQSRRRSIRDFIHRKPWQPVVPEATRGQGDTPVAAGASSSRRVTSEGFKRETRVTALFK
ncbi:uncharacterized protein LOC144106211 [Amblyomma americanum]